MDENKHGFEPNQKFTMGGIAWTVIQTGADWVKCITSDCIEKRAFDEGGKNNFAVSSLRVYLNGEFLRRLIQAGAPEEMFEYFDIDLIADDGLKNYGGDRVRIGLITCEEYRLLRGNIPALTNCLWWLATPDSPINNFARSVYSDGSLTGSSAYYDKYGVRPVCKLKSEILASYLGIETVGQSAAEPEAEILCNAEMDAKKFLEEARRMCKAQEKCEICPLGYGKEFCFFGDMPASWNQFWTIGFDKVIEAVKKWSEEHPRKTRLMDFLAKYPNAPLDGNGIPIFMPWSLGYCGDTPCYACEKAEGKSSAWCWEQEVEEDETD